MIRIRPGRSWRLNPAYLGELRALTGPRARGFTGADILDVLGIEVDGVDIAEGVGEARVLVAVDELAEALLRLGGGQPAAQATIGPGPTELVMEARGPDLILTLVSLAPPARVLASGLLVDAHAMRTAVLHAVRSLLLDLLAISPALEDAELSQRLADACALLARRPSLRPRSWPAREVEAKAVVLAEPRRNGSLQLQLPPEAMARLHGNAQVKAAPLAAHLGHGSLALVRKGAPGLQCEGAIFLLLRNLLADAAALIEAWETGERAFTLHFGPHELHWDLTTDAVRAPGWRRPLTLPPLRLARLVGLAARAYAEEALRSFRGDELARDLRDRADALDRHRADLESGDLRRAPEALSAPAPAAQPGARQGPLSPGRMRRLVYRQAWSSRAGGALRVLPFAQGPLLLELPGKLVARDAEKGDHLWTVAAAPGAVARGLELFYAEPGDALVRLDLASGEARWKRRLRGAVHPARLWPLPSGVLRSLPGEGLALVSDAGTLAFRKRLPGGAPEHVVLASRVLVAALASGSLAGLDPSDGRLLWKRRCKVRELCAAGARVLVLFPGSLASVDPAQGAPVWQAEVPEDARELTVAEGSAFMLGGASALRFSLADGAALPPLPLPWAQRLSAEEEGPVVATGAGGSAMRLDGKRWSVPASGGAPAAPALLQRGIVLLRGEETSLHGAADGLPLAQLPPARFAALGADLSCALLRGDEVEVHRLATHLSLITT